VTGLRPPPLPHHRTCGFPHPAVEPSLVGWAKPPAHPTGLDKYKKANPNTIIGDPMNIINGLISRQGRQPITDLPIQIDYFPDPESTPSNPTGLIFYKASGCSCE